jgi:hypothetical protein
MAATREIAVGDLVELTEPVGTAPAGARGGITDLLDGGRIIVEVTTLPPEPILNRIVFVSRAQLRLLR